MLDVNHRIFWDKIEEDAGSSTQGQIIGKAIVTDVAMMAILGVPDSMKVGRAIDPTQPISTTATITFMKAPKLNWMKVMDGGDLKKINANLVSKINRFERNGDGFYAKLLVAMTQKLRDCKFHRDCGDKHRGGELILLVIKQKKNLFLSLRICGRAFFRKCV